MGLLYNLPLFLVYIRAVFFPGDGLEDLNSKRDSHIWLWEMVKE
jgi:hypothetical protein